MKSIRLGDQDDQKNNMSGMRETAHGKKGNGRWQIYADMRKLWNKERTVKKG
jgi:hypothetical protein